jgi:hypothetical protein
MDWDWLPYAMLSIHESGRERIGLGDAVGSLIVQVTLRTDLAYNYSEFVFDFELPSNREFLYQSLLSHSFLSRARKDRGQFNKICLVVIFLLY